MTLLITGFEAFGGWSLNPTESVAPAVAKALGLPHAILPVDLRDAPARLRALRDRHRPRMTLHLGLSGRASAVQLERAALNVADFRIPDAGGRQPRGDRLVDDAPDGLLTRVDLHALAEVVEGSVISNSAGTYLCNALYFHGLLAGEGNALFVHLPPTPEAKAPPAQTEHGSIGATRMPLQRQIQAIDAVARYLLATLESTP